MDDYRVQLEAFEGPLDLLLYLIRKHEVDIHDIPVASITEQFLRYLEGIERIDIELAGEFLVMAATLMEIKSRMLQPAAASANRSEGEADEPDPEDPRAELVRQLLEYRRIRLAADALEHRYEDWQRRTPTARAAIDQAALKALLPAPDEIELDDLGLGDLIQAFSRIADSVNFERLGAHEVVDDDTPIELHAEDVLDQLSRDGGRAPLVRLFEGRTRGAMIGLFLACLELVRQRRLRVAQTEAGIDLELREPEASAETSTEA